MWDSDWTYSSPDAAEGIDKWVKAKAKEEAA
jgi:hypothetical protein